MGRGLTRMDVWYSVDLQLPSSTRTQVLVATVTNLDLHPDAGSTGNEHPRFVKNGFSVN
jgi:hypothetical protein